MVDDPFILLVKGISGSGKSTRVYLLLDYFESIGMRLKPYTTKIIDGSIKEVGVYCEDFNLVCIGGFYEKCGVRAWQGYDKVTGRFGKLEGMSYFLAEEAKKGHGILIDGAGVTATHRLRPNELVNLCGFGNILHVRYDYTEDQWKEYCDRISYRSGKPPKSDAMWRKRKTFGSDLRKAKEEAQQVKHLDVRVEIYDEPYDAPVWDLGVKLFDFWELHDISTEFRNFCLQSDYIKRNSFINGKV